jgi:hypothetical protein
MNPEDHFIEIPGSRSRAPRNDAECIPINLLTVAMLALLYFFQGDFG